MSGVLAGKSECREWNHVLRGGIERLYQERIVKKSTFYRFRGLRDILIFLIKRYMRYEKRSSSLCALVSRLNSEVLKIKTFSTV